MRRALLSVLLLAGCASAHGRGAGASEPQALEAGDPAVRGCIGEICGVLGDTFRIHLGRGDRVLLRAESSELDPVLVVSGPGDFRARVDDAFPDRRDAALLLEAPTRGSYLVEVEGAGEGESGLFDLHSERVDEPRGMELALDGAVERTLPAGELAWLHFRADEGALVRLRVTSPEADPFVTVFAPTGRIFSNDDAYDAGERGDERRTDSTLVVPIPVSGVYAVAVGAYEGAAASARIRSTVRPPVLAARDGGPPSSGWAGPRAGGRLLGLFVGISAYPDTPLYGAADDATFLAEAFRAARLMRTQDQLVLRDAQATRSALLGAVERLAERARPEDALVIFYSGHGEARPAAADTDELDGVDETLVLFDGELTDDELARAFDPVRAGTVVLAIDACRAGGFADDFMRRAGRMGIFSSDADVLSHTAEPHRAGGYLSHFLRRAVLGDADARPRDGFLQAGELTDELYERFVRDHDRINAGGDTEPVQRLVVDRGSVRWEDVLWAYPRDGDGSLPPVPDVVLESEDPSGVAHHRAVPRRLDLRPRERVNTQLRR